MHAELLLGLLAFSFGAALNSAWRQHVAIFRRALALSVGGVSKAALHMEINLAQLERQLSDDPTQHLSTKRMTNLPADFWQWYALLLLDHYGAPIDVLRLLQCRIACRPDELVREREGAA